MDFLKIIGESKLQGSIGISGAKNSALPLIALSTLAKNEITLENLPEVVDIKTFLSLLSMLGCAIQEIDNHTKTIITSTLNNTKANYDIVRKMRASILVLGPLLGRFGYCEVSLPGGCAIGARPVDLHIKALKKMGAKIQIQGGYIIAEAKNGLKGNVINFDKITVTGTENILMAAAMAKGKTKIINAAKEPEVVQLCEVLKESGIDIQGIGSDEIEIYGTDMQPLIFPKPICVIPDRIEAGTYLCAGAITNSQITLNNINPTHLEAIISKLEEIGFKLQFSQDSITIYPTQNPQAFELSTTEYPGFPTDMQAQFMALATQCEGSSIIQERLFENRFMHVSELQRMGANITLKGNTATIQGKSKLYGADVMATDLRASSALVLAALVAKGESNIHRIYHLDRGYESLESKLTKLGAKITREKE
ncbi:UDP-N-acetylglucosamine 1-carboxyvinyltransferase [Helicobacter pullorum]|uniref:UDP-N-acetylglucosamine 1-carboxyvinyltransferase n=1 Tax=Helicobacter pullorum TaxID=35818 RepID=UPI000816A270|nr:UDP-N-acetylglucosamine 1-carboxyvinyltransferase [Helicobacter pullorum]OCR04210.1 UDP-N-acetylglucosamine 1-carboxyvinyltransferase [Helicobacter pullorum]OCR18295.1 UDP-N-acetylglucosamine 1-carboxyvinyltransferase [Helicobacter pullorum]